MTRARPAAPAAATWGQQARALRAARRPSSTPGRQPRTLREEKHPGNGGTWAWGWPGVDSPLGPQAGRLTPAASLSPSIKWTRQSARAFLTLAIPEQDLVTNGEWLLCQVSLLTKQGPALV